MPDKISGEFISKTRYTPYFAQMCRMSTRIYTAKEKPIHSKPQYTTPAPNLENLIYPTSFVQYGEARSSLSHSLFQAMKDLF